MKMCALLILLAIISIAPAFADEPPEPCSITSLDAVQRLLLIPADSPPNPLGSFTVTVLSDGNCIPIPHAAVEVLIGGLLDSKTHLCPSAVTLGYTDDRGEVVFNIPGGGCYKARSAVVIRANGVEIREFHAVVSPDYAAWDNQGLPGKWNLRVGLPDFVAFATAFGRGVPSCHDYDNNGVTNVGDFALFGRFWAGGAQGCP